MSLLSMKNVTLIRNNQEILKDITVEFPEGMTSLIIGGTGSGKSTLMKVAAGLIPFEQGSVEFQGQDINAMSEKEYHKMQRRTGFMFQDAALWANMSLFDNLAYPILVLRPEISKKSLKKTVMDLLDKMEFKTDPLTRPAQISAGERKIISFLRAIITDPDIVFLDDPTTSLDRKSFTRIEAVIKDFKERGKTVIMVSENPLFIKKYADRLMLIRNGEIIAKGTYEELLSSELPAVVNFFKDL